MNDQVQQEPPKSPPTSTGCKPCDLEGVDGLACKAERYQKQAEITSKVAAELGERKQKYDGARQAYGVEWEAAQAELTVLGTELEKIYDLLKCRLDEGDKTCLDSAAEEVFDDIDECSPPPGCCVGDHTFDDTVADGETAAALTARIEEYTAAVQAATACFDSLIEEPKKLKDHVAELKTEVAALTIDASEADPTKLARTYARYLIAVRKAELVHIGHGFTSVKEYTDCLCKALQTIAAGWTATAVLEGARAEAVCLEKAKKKACADKVAGVLVAVLAGYECCKESSGTSSSGDGGGPSQTAPAAT
ncbi:hypothetical protein [Nocardioides aequoreus]|uniref:hypothetical protein n=1 Tax=Nocardioides aequoreus TaxID=397278 RepID=UPI0004C36825|nr:hypothetical protein [Nocardioides aequoreus]